jgi:YtkA-like
MRSRLVLSMVVVVAGLAAACSGGDDDEKGSSGAPPASGCAADNRKDTYAAGMSKTAGSLSVKLVESKPGPPIKGTNAMTFEVRDTAGQPVDGATLTVTPWMPDHAHGTPTKPVVTPAGGGVYNVEKIYLPMAGLWQIKVAVQPAGGGPLQETTFQFCLDG